MARTYTLTERQAALAFQQVDNHCKAIKNWITSAVETGDYAYADRLVKQLREYQALYATLNVEAHKQTDEAKAKAARENEVA